MRTLRSSAHNDGVELREMAREMIDVALDAELVRRARQDPADAGRSDAEIVERALTVFLGLQALDEAHAQGGLDEAEASALAVAEIRAVRVARG